MGTWPHFVRARRGHDIQRAAEHPYALAQAGQPQTGAMRPGGWIESATIVGHLHHQMAVELLEHEGYASRVRMGSDVSQGFLGDAVQAKRGVVGERVRHAVVGELDRQAVRPREFLAEAAECGDQPELL